MVAQAIATAIVGRLAGDSTLDGLLARTVVQPQTAPALYDVIPVPQGAALPYVVVPAPVSDVDDDTLDLSEYRNILIDIHSFDQRPDSGGGSRVRIDTIAERVRKLLHRRPLSLGGGFRLLTLECMGPMVRDDEYAFGRVITARLLVGDNS